MPYSSHTEGAYVCERGDSYDNHVCILINWVRNDKKQELFRLIGLKIIEIIQEQILSSLS